MAARREGRCGARLTREGEARDAGRTAAGIRRIEHLMKKTIEAGGLWRCKGGCWERPRNSRGTWHSVQLDCVSRKRQQ
eukprot:1181615-Prorocentrum_minimum.AAC.3